MPIRANPLGRFLRVGALIGALGLQALRAADGAPYVGLRDGESLTYSVRWGPILSVGRIRIGAEQVGSGPDAVMRVTTVTSTSGLARGLFAFDAKGVSTYQISSGLLLSSSEESAYRNKVIRNSLVFDYAKHTARFTDEVHPEKSRSLSLPDGNPSDLILALVRTRSWNLGMGDSRDALVIFEDQFYPLTIRPEDTEPLVCDLGVFDTVVLRPRMEKTPPIGMFKRGSTVRVWIETNDARRLPVRFEVGFRFGAGTATLTDYTPPK